MKTYEFKTKLFGFFNEQMTEKFPLLEGKIFRERLRPDVPSYPYMVLKTGDRDRINKRFESFASDGKIFIRAQYRIEVLFSVYSLYENALEAEQESDAIIDYTEQLFIDTDLTHSILASDGITVNELLAGPVRDLSSFAETNQLFRKEIKIVFEFEDIKEDTPEFGKMLDMHIESK